MNLKELKEEIKRLKKIQSIWLKEHKTESIADKKLEGIQQTIEAIEDLCEKDYDGLSTYENRHEEGKGDGIWINCLELIEIKQLLNTEKPPKEV